jgi:tRNA A-37 threonylcarbamoyl transferase component Bud32
MTGGETTVEFVRRCRHCGEALSATSSFCSKCGATNDVAPAEPDRLREQVQELFGADLDIERELGRGGMGAVFAAFDPALQRRVAVKVLLPEISNDRAMADRFLREARTVASLQHPHVVTVYAVRSAGTVHAIVMQFVEGRSLDAVLADRGKLPLHLAGIILAEAASGLQHAHDRGVIHRDVKPANVLIDHDGRAIVSDFGIARRESGPRTTETGLVVGTWAYMSPEQRSADSVTAATDQYALGVMAFELLTGQLPFVGTPAEMLRAHLYQEPPSLRALRPDVSESVEVVVNRMLAKAPEQRFPSLREPERAFRTLIPDEGQTTLQLAAYSHVARASARANASQVVKATRAAPPAARDAPTERIGAPAAPLPAPASNKRAGVAIVAAAVLIVAALGVWATRDRGAAPAPASPPANAPASAPASDNATPPPADATPRTAQPSGAARTGAQAAAPAPGGRPEAPASALPTAGAQPEAPARTEPKPEERPAPKQDAPAPEAAPARAMPSGSVADARRLGREFVTLLNQRRYREVGQLATVGGDAAVRAELLKLAETAPEFAAGFDRVPSPPAAWTNGFETEFFLDLEWRGGRKLVRIRLYASPADGGWRTVGFAAEAP